MVSKETYHKCQKRPTSTNNLDLVHQYISYYMVSKETYSKWCQKRPTLSVKIDLLVQMI